MRAREIADFLETDLHGSDLVVTGPSPLSAPVSGTVVFTKSTDVPSDLPGLDSVLLIGPVGVASANVFRESVSFVEVDDPRNSFARVTRRFFAAPKPAPGIHPTAVISPDATIDPSATVGPHCVVEASSRIGADCELVSGVRIGPKTILGVGCSVGPNTSIGHPGFGFERDDEGRPFRIPHIGGVHLGDHVEIGALNTVCSGTLSPTLIADHVKTDDHVHIAHNVKIGENTLITSCAVLAGSVTVGRDCWLSPNTTIMNGVTLGDDVTVGMGATVVRDLVSGETVMGAPARRVTLPEERAGGE